MIDDGCLAMARHYLIDPEPGEVEKLATKIEKLIEDFIVYGDGGLFPKERS